MYKGNEMKKKKRNKLFVANVWRQWDKWKWWKMMNQDDAKKRKNNLQSVDANFKEEVKFTFLEVVL